MNGRSMAGFGFDKRIRQSLRLHRGTNTPRRDIHMATDASSTEQALAKAKISPSAAAKIASAAVSDAARAVNEVRKKALERTKKARDLTSKPIALNVLVVAGGALAEVNRRSGVGRVVSSVAGQAVGLAVSGAAVQAAESYLGLVGLRGIGIGHMGAAGMVGAVWGYDKKDKRDPVAVALEGTTHKFKKDSEKKKEEDKKD